MIVTFVQPYDPAWPSHFQQIKAFLEPSAVDVVYATENTKGVGSCLESDTELGSMLVEELHWPRGYYELA